MQLTLSTPPFAKPSAAKQPAHKAGRPRDEAVLSQLDQIAEQNLQASRHGLGVSAMFLALIGGLVILGSASMWSASDEPSRKPVAAVTEARLEPAIEIAVASAPVVAVASPSVNVVEPSVQAAPEPALAASAELTPAVDDAARKARAAKAAEGKRKAAQLTQERALAEETQRLQLAQQREGERAQQLAEQARQRAAAEQTRLAAAASASDSRLGVGDACSAAGGFVSRQFCHARECRKAEHQTDGVCVNLRETEAARVRASAER